MPFSHLKLHPALQKAVKDLSYLEATPIQHQAIPDILKGHDILGTAPTGSGKTAAYLLPALQLIMDNEQSSSKKGAPKILILAPTRELATQIQQAAIALSRHLKMHIVSILGGMPYREQQRQLSKPIDILVATPGRLIDYLERGSINLSTVRILVLDEADRMLDMGFIDAVKLITEKTAKKRQTLLFTATFDNRLAKLAHSILRDPKRIEVTGKAITLENIEQRLHLVDGHAHKTRLLKQLLTTESVFKAIIFSATKRGADDLAKQLREEGHPASALHGDMKQNARNRTLMQLRKGKISILVATDVAARGIDIPDISHVINYDLPKFAEDYIHRIGRTGRAGKTGIAISFASSSERGALKRIERFTKQNLVKENHTKEHQSSGYKSRDNNSRDNHSRDHAPRDRKPKKQASKEYSSTKHRANDYRSKDREQQDFRSESRSGFRSNSRPDFRSDATDNTSRDHKPRKQGSKDYSSTRHRANDYRSKDREQQDFRSESRSEFRSNSRTDSRSDAMAKDRRSNNYKTKEFRTRDNKSPEYISKDNYSDNDFQRKFRHDHSDKPKAKHRTRSDKPCPPQHRHQKSTARYAKQSKPARQNSSRY